VVAALLTALVGSLSGVAGADGVPGSPAGRASPVPPAAGAQPAGALPGIDVSHHQDTIDWIQVAGSGQRFAFLKATEGRTFVDPEYATNRAGAEAVGMVVGAYHFAQPDDGPNDAVIEADHFVDTAQLEPGNLLPVLDIERTGGLTEAEVTTWILTWLGRVTERLGVRPIVYTSPGGWDARTGDTTAVADAGYTVLWVAHWGVEVPRLPANDWQGNGWTFWQYGNCGSIPGIEGCVDVDWYETTSFDPVSIPSPDVTPPIATFAPPADVADPLQVAFSEVVRHVSTDNLYLWSPRSGTYPPVGLSCRNRQGVAVDCVSGNVRAVTMQPLDPLIPGEVYEVVANPAVVSVVIVDRSGNPLPTTTSAVATPTSLEQDSAAAAYAWRDIGNRRAFGRAYTFERSAGATASFAFTGPSATWFTATGPAQGRASVWVDGTRLGTFDQYAPTAAYRVARRFARLGRGPHVLTVRVLGSASSAATDTQVVVDAFETAAGRTANPALDVTWGRVTVAGASDGVVASSDVARAAVEVTFRGTGIVWTTIRGRDQGRAGIYVDGLLVRRVDNYAPARTTGVARSVGGLADGVHTLRIVVLGEGRPAARGTAVAVDGFTVSV
jgi:GH25 family lysozyme M1 (1,4-beta-N-acetylmuramidase)